jgi:tetratricopeptide (TPR) repeat protein
MYYCKKQYAEALPYLRVALKTQSKNPVLLCRAGLIYASTGNRNEAKALLQLALVKDPNIEAALKTASLDTLLNYLK